MSFYTDKNQIIQWNCIQRSYTEWNCVQRSCTEWNCIHKTFTVPCEKSKTVSFASSRIKNILVFPALSKFAVNLFVELL